MNAETDSAGMQSYSSDQALLHKGGGATMFNIEGEKLNSSVFLLWFFVVMIDLLSLPKSL